MVKATIDLRQVKLNAKNMTRRLQKIQMVVRSGTRQLVTDLKTHTPKATGKTAKAWKYKTRLHKQSSEYSVQILHNNPTRLKWLEYGTQVDASNLIVPVNKLALSFKPTDSSLPTDSSGRIARAWAHQHELKPHNFIRPAMKRAEKRFNNFFALHGFNLKVDLGKPSFE